MFLTDAVLQERLKEGEETRVREQEGVRLRSENTDWGFILYTFGEESLVDRFLLVHRGSDDTPGFTLHLHLIGEFDLPRQKHRTSFNAIFSFP